MNPDSAQLQHRLLKHQIVEELALGAKWRRMPGLLDRMHEARLALEAGSATRPRSWQRTDDPASPRLAR